jgi:hypothetical protein
VSQKFLDNHPGKYRLVQTGKKSPNTTIVRADKEHKTLEVTHPDVLQPWQKAEAKKRERAASHAHPDDRRKARELRKELEKGKVP